MSVDNVEEASQASEVRQQDEPAISVIVMAFNEVESIRIVVQDVHATLMELGLSYEVLVIDDGSSDGTGRLADRLAEELPHVRVIHHEHNRGLGMVYRTGFSKSRGVWLAFFPSDGQIPPMVLKRFLPLMGCADLVLGDAATTQRPWLARILSRTERVLYRFFIAPLPRFQGVLMFRRSLLERLELKSTGRGWTVLMELILRAVRDGYRVVNVPTDIRPRMSGRSKVHNLSVIVSNFTQMIALRQALRNEVLPRSR